MQMKKFSFLLMIVLVAVAAKAQKYDDVRNMLALGKYADAKKELDKGMTNAKFTSKPDAYILKASVYGHMALDSTQPQAQLRDEAHAALMKYMEMDPALKVMNDDPFYKNAPIEIYSAYFASGYKDYEKKQWAEGLPKFQKTVEMSEMMSAKNVPDFNKVDTNSLILAGLMAEQSKNGAEAAKYYSKLAALKINKAEFEDVYRYLVRYYVDQKDMASFEKYKALGKELYPKSEFFDYDKVDFAVGLVEGFDNKIKALEQILANDPGNYKANMILGELIYDTLDSRKEGSVPPANAAELEPKMVAALLKGAETKPESASQSYIYLGDHYMNKSDKEQEAVTALKTEIKTKAKPGAKTSPADQQRINEAQKKYDATYDQVALYYGKVADIFGKKATLDKTEKRQYKIVVGNLAQYYSYKREGAKGAELTKYIAEEKKWNDLDSTLK